MKTKKVTKKKPKKPENKSVLKSLAFTVDHLGSYTGNPINSEDPTQDADDL